VYGRLDNLSDGLAHRRTRAHTKPNQNPRRKKESTNSPNLERFGAVQGLTWLLVGLVEVTAGPGPPHPPQTKAPGLCGAWPSSARNWCSFRAKLPMASAPSGSARRRGSGRGGEWIGGVTRGRKWCCRGIEILGRHRAECSRCARAHVAVNP
jgi:hypothetical protein